MRRTASAITAFAVMVALVFGPLAGTSAAYEEMFGYGWRETSWGVAHCTTDRGNQVVCDRIGPDWSWYTQGAVEFWWPWFCKPVDLIGGWQGGAPARIRLAGSYGYGCGLGLYPSQTQAFAAWAGSPPAKVAYEGAMALRPNGINGGPTVTITVEQGCSWCAASARYLDIVMY